MSCRWQVWGFVAVVLGAAGWCAAAEADRPWQLRVEKTLAVGRHPLGMAMSPDGRRLYAVFMGEFTAENAPGVAVIDVHARRVLRRVALGPGSPRALALSPDGSRAYVAVAKRYGANETVGQSRVDVIDTAGGRVLDRIVFDALANAEPVRPVVSPDGKTLYVADRGAQRIEVIDTATNAKRTPIYIGGGSSPTGLAITPDGARLYVASREKPTLYVVDLARGDVVATIRLGLLGGAAGSFVTIDRTGTRAYVTYSSDPRVAVVDVAPDSKQYNRVVRTIEAASGDLGNLALDPNGPRALLLSDGGLLLLDLDGAGATLAELLHVEFPGWVVFGPGATVAFASSMDDDTVSVIRIGHEGAP